MKIIKNGRVYDMDYGAYETIARIPGGWESNEVGNMTEVTRELRRDKASGLFYVCTSSGGYSRDHYAVVPMAKDEAMKLVEDYLDYDAYVKFFGDPEGANKGLERERDDALKKLESAISNSDYWYKESIIRGDRITELEKRIAELEAK